MNPKHNFKQRRAILNKEREKNKKEPEMKKQKKKEKEIPVKEKSWFENPKLWQYTIGIAIIIIIIVVFQNC